MMVRRGYAEHDVRDLGPGAGVRTGHLMAAERLGFRASGGRVATVEKADEEPVRTADEAVAVRAVLHRSHERARALVAQLELEAADPRVRELHQRARSLQQDIALLIIDLVPDRSTPSPVERDCRECLVSSSRCEFDRSLGVGPCCGACSHG